MSALARLFNQEVPSRTRTILVAASLCAFAFLCVFHELGGGALSVFDEGLHGTLARRMLSAGRYLALVDENGAYSMETGFSKPPLLLWLTAFSIHAFGASLFALRLPIAIALLVSTGTLFFIARRLSATVAEVPGAHDGRASRVGVIAAVLLVTCTGAQEFGRTSNIEVLFTMFALVGLACAMRARREAHPHLLAVVATGLALAGAFMTKQIVVVLPLFALACVELASIRSDGPRAALLRLIVPAVGVAVVGGAWLLLAREAMGDGLIDVLWRFTVQDRVQGFGGDRHFNWLNRVADHLDIHAHPMPWPLGVIGVCLLAGSRQRARGDGRVDESWLFVAWLVAATLAFENASRSTLVWYVFSMVPPIAIGTAHLVAHGLRAARALLAQVGASALDARGGLGLATIALLVDGALQHAISRLDLVVVFGLALAFAWVARARVASWTARAFPALEPLLTAALVAVLGLSVAAHPAHHRGVSPEESLMERVGPFGEVAVSVDERMLARASAPDLRRTTLFGAKAVRGPAPWTKDDRQTRVRVEWSSWPTELAPRDGVSIARGPGGLVLSGDLSRAPFSATDVDALLEAGPLTFEAEECITQLPDSLVSDARYSAGGARAMSPDDDEKPPKGALTSGPWFTLPAGRYQAHFDIGYRCGGFAWPEEIGRVEVHALGRALVGKDVTCPKRASGEARAATLVVDFTLASPTPVDLVVRYERGVLSHDKTVIVRSGEPPKRPE